MDWLDERTPLTQAALTTDELGAITDLHIQRTVSYNLLAREWGHDGDGDW